MVEIKKPAAKPATPAVTAARPATSISATQRRPALPSLSPLTTDKPDFKSAASAAKEITPDNSSEKLGTPADSELAATAAKPSTAQAEAAQAIEKVGPKIRKRDEIIAALRAGAHIKRIDGLCRIVYADGKMSATSKRRIVSLQTQKLLVASGDGKTLTLDVEADKKAQLPKYTIGTSASARTETSASSTLEAK